MSTAPALDTRAHSSAIRAAIEAMLGGSHAYDYDDVPGSPQAASPDLRAEALPDIYAAVSVERRYTPPRRITAQAGRSGWRVAVRAVGRTVDEARWAQKRVAEALDEAQLTIDGHTTTAFQHESWSDAEHDDGRYSGLTVYTYGI